MGRSRYESLVIGTVAILVAVAGLAFARHPGVSSVGWLILAMVAGVIWLRTRERAVALYGIGLAVVALSGMGTVAGWPLAHAVLFPLFPIGMALAAFHWAGAQRGLPQVLVRLAVIVAILDWFYLATFAWHRGQVQLATVLTGVSAACFILLAVVAWRGYRSTGVQPLLWLGVEGAVLGLSTMAGVAGVFGLRFSGLIPQLLYLLLFTLPLGLAVAVVWTAAVPRGRSQSPER